MGETTAAFVDHCRTLGIANATLVTPKLFESGALEQAQAALAADDVQVTCVNHPFGVYPDLDRDTGEAAHQLDRAIDLTAELHAPSIYLISGGRGSLDWEAAAERFADLIAPCRRRARDLGITLLVENASPLTADIHIAHTINDALALAQAARIDICLDLHACWWESAIEQRIANAVPRTGLIQVSDYVLGDRTTPCRAVPGDGAIPLQRLIAAALDAGYTGLFDLELVGPRIDAEGGTAASTRAAAWLSDTLTRLGA